MVSDKVKLYCCEDISKIENYNKAITDTTQIYIIHHKLGIKNSRSFLKKQNLYYNRPASELIFLTPSEHAQLHANNRFDGWNKKISTNTKIAMNKPETKKKLSERQIGEKNHNYNKHMTQESKEKLSKTLKGRFFTKEWREKISKSKKGKTNSLKGKKFLLPSEEMKKRFGVNKGKTWWNNGVYSVLQEKCPKGFTKGRIIVKKDT